MTLTHKERGMSQGNLTRWDQLRDLVQRGRDGNPIAIPVPFKRLKQDVDIAREMYYVVGGDTGTGKSAFTHFTFVLWPYMWWKTMVKKGETDIKLKIFIRSMERPFKFTAAKWAAIRIYMKYKVLVDPLKILGRRRSQMADEHYQMVAEAFDYFEDAEDVVELIPGSVNPTGIFMQLKDWANQNGKVITEGKYKKRYVPNDPNLITLIIADHVGKAKTERSSGQNSPMLTEKQTIDRLSDYIQEARDLWGFSGVAVQQFNRTIAAVDRRTKMDLTPELQDFLGTGNTLRDADVVMSLFDPYQYQVAEWQQYKVGLMTDTFGINRFRGLSVLKNTYGASPFHTGMQFIGECGYWRQLLLPKDMTEGHYSEYASLPNVKKL